jgi:endo-1,4-beta-D-glucanase Y
MHPLRNRRSLGTVLFAGAVFFLSDVQAQMGNLWPRPVNNNLPHIAEPLRGRMDSALVKTWQGIRKRNIDAYPVKLFHRPNSEQPHDAVSEGVGYAMLMALYVGDQAGFDQVWDAGETYLFQGEYYDWRADRDGKRIGTGAATDADEDIAVALLFADALQRKGIWKAHKSPKGASYIDRAKSLMEAIWSKMIADGKYIKPGSGWGGPDQYNPSYFAPAWYRLFKQAGSNHDWDAVINQGYQSLKLSPGYGKGLIPDWMKAGGGYAGALGYNAYGEGRHMYKDAIRVYWRMSIDALWFKETRGMEFMKNAMAFVGSADKCNFFTMDGQPVPETFELGNKVTRPRSEHSHLTVGMWAGAALAAAGPVGAQPFAEELMKFYEGGDFWGKKSDPNGEDTLHNEMYFDQCLAWFGAATLTGAFANIVDNVANPVAGIRLEDPLLGRKGSFRARVYSPVLPLFPSKSAFSGWGQNRQNFNWNGARLPEAKTGH